MAIYSKPVETGPVRPHPGSHLPKRSVRVLAGPGTLPKVNVYLQFQRIAQITDTSGTTLLIRALRPRRSRPTVPPLVPRVAHIALLLIALPHATGILPRARI